MLLLLTTARSTALTGFAPAGSPELALAKWVTSEGGHVSSKLRVKANDGVRGLFVSDAVVAGERLLTIPRASVISAEEDPQWGLSLRELLTARLCGAIARGESAPYIDALPADEPILCDWSEPELAELQSASLVEFARGLPPFLDESVERLLPFVKVERERVAWAERMVRSRALLFESGWELYVRTMCLVPLLDLANHRTPPRRRGATSQEIVEPVSLSLDEQAVTLAARCDLAAGSEVFICYDYNGNRRLLADYGFAELIDANEQPSREQTRLPLPLPQKADDDEATHGEATLVLGTDELDAAALATLRLHAADEAGDEAGGAGGAGGAVCAALLAACETELARAPTTEAHDRDVLASGAAPPEGVGAGRWRSALAYRIGQKAQLAATAAALSGLLADAEEEEGARPLDEARVRDALRALRSEDV